MQTIKTVLVDDEELAIASLKWQMEEFCPQVEIVATFTSPRLAFNFLEDRKDIQLCFLDIDMPEMSGFDFLKLWEKPPPFDVIFATAYNEFAIKAFKVSAFDYLLKPIDEEELMNTIQKFNNKLEKSDWNKKINLLYQSLNQTTSYPDRISLATREGVHLVSVDQIIHLEAYKNYTSVYLQQQGTIVVSKTIKDIEQLLDPTVFVRVHQSHIVNWQQVSTYQRGQNGSLVLTNGKQIPVSKQKKNIVLSRIFPQ